MIKKMKRRIDRMEKGVEGIREWFKYFDKDGSEDIEVAEFARMMAHLDITMEDRLGLMLFRLFDRRDEGCFHITEFIDVIN